MKAYLVAVSDCSIEAVERACTAFLKGQVIDFNNDFASTGPRLAEEARKWDAAMRTHAEAVDARSRERLVGYPIGALPPPPAVPLGPLEVDFGTGVINMRGMSPAEKEAVLRNKCIPPSIASGAVRPQLRKMNR